MIASFLIILGFFHLLFLIGTYRRNNATADVGWGVGFILVALWFAATKSLSWPLTIGVGLVVLWGARLTLHLFIRQIGEPEDKRYQAFRKNWGDHPVLHAYFKVYLVQAIVMFLVALPIVFLGLSQFAPFNWYAALFLLLALFGICYEAIADYQLSTFKSKPSNKGKRLASGLWQYSRHPNYFGEIVFWWSFGFYVVATTGQLLALIGPLVINVIIVYVSGVPLTKSSNQPLPAVIPSWLFFFKGDKK